MRLRGNVWAATFVAVAAATSSANGATKPGVVSAAYDGFPVTPPTPNVIFVCHGFGCKYRAEFDLTGNDRATIYGALLCVADKLQSDQREHARALWNAKGKQAFEADRR